MPELSNLEESIDSLATHHMNIGYPEPDSFEETHEDGEVRGFNIVDESGVDFYVAGHSNHQYVEIRYSYDVIEDIAERLTEEAAREMVDSNEKEADSPSKDKAAVNLIREINSEEIRNIQFELHNIITQPRVWAELNHRSDGILSGFEVRSRLYPHDRKVTIRDYEEQLSYVVAPAKSGYYFLVYTLNLDYEDSIAQLSDELIDS